MPLPEGMDLMLETAGAEKDRLFYTSLIAMLDEERLVLCRQGLFSVGSKRQSDFSSI